MAAADPTLVWRAPGALYLNPTNLVAPPYGGTALGLVHAYDLRPITREDPVVAEEYGGETTETVFLGRDWRLVATIRAWDNDALAALPWTTAAGLSGKRVVTEPGTHIAGDLGTAKAGKLLFAARDSRAPSFVLYRAIPQLEESARLRFEITNELNIPVVWRALRGAGGNSVQIGVLGDLTL